MLRHDLGDLVMPMKSTSYHVCGKEHLTHKLIAIYNQQFSSSVSATTYTCKNYNFELRSKTTLSYLFRFSPLYGHEGSEVWHNSIKYKLYAFLLHPSLLYCQF